MKKNYNLFKLSTFVYISLITLLGSCSNSETNQPPTNSVQSNISNSLPNNPKINTEIIPKETTKIIAVKLPENQPDLVVNTEVEKFIKTIIDRGGVKENQGVWIQSGNKLLGNYQGNIPLPAASVTKTATTIAALKKWGPDHQFITQIGITGKIEKGEVKGDLIIQGGEDPFFVWEEAIALGNTLNKLGIKKIQGNLIIVGKFYMNFESNPQTAGNLLKEGLNSEIWQEETQQQYQTLPPDTAKPKVIIAGVIKAIPTAPENQKLLIRHYSFPLAELLKKMNMYSNNMMAQMLADAVGGAKIVAETAAEAAGVPPEEIQLINGSGLGEENKISPRAAVGITQAIELFLKHYNMTIADVMAIAQRDLGVLNGRKIPELSVVKTGTLNYVASIAGAIPTEKIGPVWIAIMNKGENVEEYRVQQDILLNNLVNKWGAVKTPPAELTPSPARRGKTSRIEVINTVK